MLIALTLSSSAFAQPADADFAGGVDDAFDVAWNAVGTVRRHVNIDTGNAFALFSEFDADDNAGPGFARLHQEQITLPKVRTVTTFLTAPASCSYDSRHDTPCPSGRHRRTALHHAVGNNRQDVFFVDDDRRYYLDMLKVTSEQYGLMIHGHCLMTNHVHIVATPTRKDSLAKAIGRTNYFYTRYVNKPHGRSGHLWQNRFFSCPLDEFYFLNTICCVERNPIRTRVLMVPYRRMLCPTENAIAGRADFPTLAAQRMVPRAGRRSMRHSARYGPSDPRYCVGKGGL